MQINLPDAGGQMAPYELTGRPPRVQPAPRHGRIAYSAAHVVSDPHADIDPWLGCADTRVSPPGRLSFTVTFVASLGPLLLTTSVYMTWPPFWYQT